MGHGWTLVVESLGVSDGFFCSVVLLWSRSCGGECPGGDDDRSPVALQSSWSAQVRHNSLLKLVVRFGAVCSWRVWPIVGIGRHGLRRFGEAPFGKLLVKSESLARGGVMIMKLRGNLDVVSLCVCAPCG